MIPAKRLAILLALVAVAAHGTDTFDQRVHRAKLVESQGDGKPYVHDMWMHVEADANTAMRACFKAGTPPDTSAFVMVANVLPTGGLGNIDLRPRTPMAQCFADRFAKAPFPLTPTIFGDAGVPIVIEMNIKP
ncbi:MAG: hypothetical protein WB784_02910 [Rhodanobacteraceae bacterium]